MRSAVFDISFQCSYPSNEHRHQVRTWDNAATNTCTDLSHVKTEHNRLQQEPITRNVQLHCICGTAFLQTELFLDYFPAKPDLSGQSHVLHEKLLLMELRMVTRASLVPSIDLRPSIGVVPSLVMDSWGPFLESPETLRVIFGCHNSLCILRTERF